MYAKLIFRNAKRSAKDYLIYIVTLTICVTLFYAFLSISSSYYQPDIGTAYEITAFSDGIKLAVCAITLLLLFLIRYGSQRRMPAPIQQNCGIVPQPDTVQKRWTPRWRAAEAELFLSAVLPG